MNDHRTGKKTDWKLAFILGGDKFRQNVVEYCAAEPTGSINDENDYLVYYEANKAKLDKLHAERFPDDKDPNWFERDRAADAELFAKARRERK